MIFWKRVLLLFSLFALLLGALWYPFRKPLGERASVVINGWGERTFLLASAGENGVICAASRQGTESVLSTDKRADTLELRFFNQQGEMLEEWSVPLPAAAMEGELCALYPVDRDTAFLAFWQEDGSQTLCVYRAKKDSMPEAILTQRGIGSSRIEQRESLKISSFSRSLDQVFFVLFGKDRASSYTCPVSDGGATKLEEQYRAGNDVLSAAALPDGRMVVAGNGFLIAPGWRNTGVSAGQAFTHLTCTSSGIYSVEIHNGTVWYSDLTGVSVQQLYSLSSAFSGHQISSLSLTPSGDTLLLLDGHTISLVRGGGVINLTTALYPGRAESLVALVFYVLLAGFLTFLIWQVLSIIHQNRIPLSLYWGTVLLALALVMGFEAFMFSVIPAQKRAVLEHRSELFGSMAGLILREDSRGAVPLPGGGTVNTSTYSDDFLARRMDALLQDAGAPEFRNAHCTLASRNGLLWFLQDGSRAELNTWFSPTLAWDAEMNGAAASQNGGRFWYARNWGDKILCVSADVEGNGLALRVMMAWGLALSALLLVILLLVNLDVRRVAGGLERYAGNGPWHTLRLRSGDELEGMAASLNALAEGKAAKEAQREMLVDSYRRFVPEPVINLLGKRSILEVSKESFAVRDMTVMAVSFTFPDSLYSNQENTRMLFQSVNQVIERTASIAAQKGGIVFNFSYDSYDVVFDSSAQALSAAVAMGQEALSMNERSAADALPPVKLRIALDMGSVIIGIVGDGTHLEQTTISSHFAMARSFLRLCEKLDAGILCTERVAASVQEYGSRYVGKSRTGQARIYEFFDGDPYSVRNQKASTLRRFSQAVLHLYSGNVAEAKRTFLALAHETPNDGAARYYLYLADRMEQSPDLPCELIE